MQTTAVRVSQSFFGTCYLIQQWCYRYTLEYTFISLTKLRSLTTRGQEKHFQMLLICTWKERFRFICMVRELVVTLTICPLHCEDTITLLKMHVQQKSRIFLLYKNAVWISAKAYMMLRQSELPTMHRYSWISSSWYLCCVLAKNLQVTTATDQLSNTNCKKSKRIFVLKRP